MEGHPDGCEATVVILMVAEQPEDLLLVGLSWPGHRDGSNNF